METTVRDDPEESRYEIRDGDRVLGLAAYERRGDTTVFTHTEVDPDAGQDGPGQHAGARRAGRRPQLTGGSVVAQCSFVRGWIERHPEYADLVVAARTDDRPGRRRPRPGRPGRAGHPARVRRLRVPVLRRGRARAAPGGGGVRRAGAAGVPQLPARRRAPLRADRGPGRGGRGRPGRLLADARAALRPAGPAGRRRAARLRRRARARRQPGGGGRRPRSSATRSRPTSPPASRPGSAGTPDRLHRRRSCTPGRVEAGALRRAIGSAASGANGSAPDGRRDPGPGRQRRWSLGLRRAQREALPEDPEQDDPGDRCDH